MTTKHIKSNEVRRDWADVLQYVRTGGTVVVEHYNRPIATITPYVKEPAVAVTYTHPDLPRLALRAEDLGNGVWRRSLLIDGVVTHSIDRPETIPNRRDAATQASQAGFSITALAHASGPDAGAAAQAREAIGEHESDIGDLAAHIAQGRATAQTGDTSAAPATAEIASHIPGRSIHSYDLLDEVTEQHGMSRSDAHDAIHALLSQIVDIDGEDAVILGRRPMRPELLDDNPQDLDVYYWLTISEETAQTIREAIASGAETATMPDMYAITADPDTVRWLTATSGLDRLGGYSDTRYGLEDLGDGRVGIPAGSLPVLMELDEGEDGCVTSDGDHCTMWIEGLAYPLTPTADRT